MQHYKMKTSRWMCAATSIFVSSTVHAAIPPINITLSSGSNVISVAPGQTATVEYLIQDVIGRPPARTWLWNAPIPAYMSRTASLHQPDCSVYNQNPAVPNSFVLPPNGSCYFAMEVNGTILASQTTSTITYKPLFSNSGAIAYGPCSPLQLTPLPPPTTVGILLAAGGYLWQSDTPQRRPLLVSSRDEGATWVYPDSIPSIPNTIPFDNEGVINGTSCTGNTCIAAGLAQDIGNNNFALLAVSQDAALTWNYETSITTPVFSPNNANPYTTDGRLFSASCSGSTCIAGGHYLSGTTQRPLLAVSLNSGVFWIYPDSITAPVFTPVDTNPFNGSGNFNSVSCSGSLCIAGGNYATQSAVVRPLLAMSQDAGATWTYPVSINEVTFDPINLNPFNTSGNFFGVSCSGSNCVAAGSYLDLSAVIRPLIAFTNDGGNTWTYPTPVTNPVVVPTFASGQFASATCSGSHCVAAGFYTDNVAVQHPLLAQSQDGGDTWTYPANIPVPVFTNTFASGSFKSTSCSGVNCIAVGTYTDTNGVIRPLLASSQDGGVTWTYSEPITTPVFVPTNSFPFDTDGQFNAASCDGNICIAAGAYNDVNTFIGTRPLLAFSLDGGVTWTYPEPIVDPVFTPANTYPFFAEGVFDAATAVSSSYLPEGLNFLLKP